MTQFNANLGPLRLCFEWRLTLFTATLIPLLLSLGFWQLDRADDKRLLAQRYHERAALPALNVKDLQQLLEDTSQDRWLDAIADRSVMFDGHLETGRYVFIDNQTRTGQFGYDVLVFVETDSAWVAVNLGWIAGDPARRTLPDVQLDNGTVRFSGRVYLPSKAPYMLAEPSPLGSIPSVVQRFQPELIDTATLLDSNRPLLPVEIRINESDPLALQADWPVVNQSPAKHTGYAVQWFTMGAVLFFAFILGSSNLWSLVRRRPAAS